ncbi:hypothetical protein INR49_032382 [Caranx melampygus]|nr:hypothetical protein INR49_032382 [Caranx melampygus]
MKGGDGAQSGSTCPGVEVSPCHYQSAAQLVHEEEQQRRADALGRQEETYPVETVDRCLFERKHTLGNLNLKLYMLSQIVKHPGTGLSIDFQQQVSVQAQRKLYYNLDVIRFRDKGKGVTETRTFHPSTSTAERWCISLRTSGHDSTPNHPEEISTAVKAQGCSHTVQHSPCLSKQLPYSVQLKVLLMVCGVSGPPLADLNVRPAADTSSVECMEFPQAHLCLCEAQLCSQLSTLRQGQVLGRLESPLQDCQLVAGVDGPGLAHLLGLPVDHPDLHLWFFFHCKRFGGGVELTTVLHRCLHIPAEGSVLSVRSVRVRVLCFANWVRATGTHPVQVIVVIGVRVHVLGRVLLLRRVEILRAVERTLAAVEAHVCGGGLRQGRGILGGRDGAPNHGERRFLLLEDR